MLDYDVMDNEYDEDEDVLTVDEVREYLDDTDGIDYSFDDDDNLVVHTKSRYSGEEVFPGFGVVLDDLTKEELDEAISRSKDQREEFEAFLSRYATKLGYGLWLVFAFGYGYNYVHAGNFEAMHRTVRELEAFDELEIVKLCGATELCEDIVNIEDVDLHEQGMSALIEAVKEDFNRHCKDNIEEIEAKIKEIEESIKAGTKYDPIDVQDLFFHYLDLSNWDEDYDGFWDNYDPDERTVTVDYSATIFTDGDGAYDICYLKHVFRLPDGLTVEDDT